MQPQNDAPTEEELDKQMEHAHETIYTCVESLWAESIEDEAVLFGLADNICELMKSSERVALTDIYDACRYIIARCTEAACTEDTITRQLAEVEDNDAMARDS